MQKVSIILISILTVVVIIVGSIARARQVQLSAIVPADKLHVVATFYPLGDFAEHVGGQSVFVTVATPNGTEPHEFEPTLKDTASYEDAQVFIMNGGEVDAWAADVAADITRRGGIVVNMSSLIPLDGTDPHIWVNPVYAKHMVSAIADAFKKADAVRAREYEEQAAAYEAELSALDESFVSGLKTCQLRDVIVAHDAFDYLAKQYTFTTHPILGLSPEEEPSAKKMTELAKLVKKLGIQIVFFEELSSPKFAETIATESGAQAKVLSPVEGQSAEEQAAGEGYVEIMTKNLQALQNAMLCS